MHKTRTLATGAVAVLTTPALAQDGGTATWLWDVTTQNGDAIVEPGETATITLSVDMRPDVNFPDGPALGLAAAIFDVIGGANVQNGSIVGWEILNNLDLCCGDQTTSDGFSLFGVEATNPLEILTPDDPIDVIAFEWSPDALSKYEVEYATQTEVIAVWEGQIGGEVKGVQWENVEADIAFQVVPASPTISTLLIATWAVPRRNRGRVMERPELAGARRRRP